MVFLYGRRRAGQTRIVDVDARKAWGNGGPAETRVPAAEAQLILPLNGHEVQPLILMSNGAASLTIAPPEVPRWDFEHGSRYKLPPITDVESLVEVHVTDLETGGHGFVSV